MELDENQNTILTVVQPSESTPVLDEPPSKPASPKPRLSMTLANLDENTNGNTDIDALGASLKPVVDAGLHSLDGTKGVVDTGVELDISGLGPDGLDLDTSLTQIDPSDAIVDGPLLNHPFVQDTP